jgi:ClpP class serine protease
VWTGSDAVDAGLVDRIGGLRDAVQLARVQAGLPANAPVYPATQLGLLARLRRPKNSADPRTSVSATMPRLADITTVLGLPAAAALRMPQLRLR